MKKRLHANKSCCGACASGDPCEGKKQRAFQAAKLQVNDATLTTYEGRETIIVPLVMAKASVVMNDYLLPLEEMQEMGWNGVPVTVDHPQVDNEFVSASSSPAISASYKVGTIFDTHIEGDKLKAFAYIDTQKAEEVCPGLVEHLREQLPLDVSTGFFGDVIDKPGTLNGQDYLGVHKSIIPDHLALLPFEDGACSWDDGCGVRANKSQTRIIDKLLEAFMKLKTNKVKTNKPAPKTHERGDDDNFTQMVADLISSEASPFLPDDEYGLKGMSEDTLKKMRDAFLNADSEEVTTEEEDEEVTTEEDEDETVVNEDDEEVVTEEEDEEKPSMNKRKRASTNKLVLNGEDREALAFARQSFSAHKDGLIARIVANTNMTEKQLKTFSVNQLEDLASGLRETPVPSYAGRVAANAGDTDATAEGMHRGASGVLAVFQKKAS